ncbi:MAG: hypothetical protein HYR55_14155 [Acidobacteria bacterium]|nr:hypothetical protein [Acidobacteriota bacterium]MBI3657362.1 hypothetical protein [Acidobacteriota bacterium]
MYERFKNLGHEVCQCLRSKSMYVEAAPDLTVPPANDESYWCVLTQSVLGPDDGLAAPTACKRGRACFYILD